MNESKKPPERVQFSSASHASITVSPVTSPTRRCSISNASNTAPTPEILMNNGDLDDVALSFSHLLNGALANTKLRLPGNPTEGLIGSFPATDPHLIQQLTNGNFLNPTGFSLELQPPTCMAIPPSAVPLARVKRGADSRSFDANPHDRPRLAPIPKAIASFNTNPKHPWRDVRHKQAQYTCESCNKVTPHTTEEVSSRHCFPKKAEIQASADRPKSICEVATCVKCGQESQHCLAVAGHGRLVWGTDTKGVTTKEKLTCLKCNALWKEARSKKDKSHKSLTMGMWTRCEYCKALYKFARGDDGHRTADKCAEHKYIESLPVGPASGPDGSLPRKMASKRDKEIVKDLLNRKVFESLPFDLLKQIKTSISRVLKS